MMQDRREFFQSLIAGGAAVKERTEHRNRKAHHAGEKIYHGPMAVPARVAAIIADHPAIKRTTHRQLVSRYAADGWVWLFRCQIPEHRLMVGEIVRTLDEGKIRVHCWSAADPDRYTSGLEPAEIIAAKQPPAECPDCQAARPGDPDPIGCDTCGQPGREPIMDYAGIYRDINAAQSPVLPPLLSPTLPAWGGE